MKDQKDLKLQEITPAMLEPESPSDCEFCSLLCQSSSGKGPADSPSMHFMTERELRVLGSMRRLKQEASRIKAHMRETGQQGPSEDGGASLSERLADLRAEWKKMDQERMDAAEERMRLLGHIQ